MVAPRSKRETEGLKQILFTTTMVAVCPDRNPYDAVRDVFRTQSWPHGT